MTQRSLPYRPDIDGLRAFAVLSVLVFHAFPDVLQGGFLGVDIFFVISGYLISGILFDHLNQNKFRLFQFYSKRIRRIFPALITVLLFCLVSGYFLLYDEEYERLGKHIGAGAGFVSNFVLWKEAGYFDEAARLKPLLHLWSLGIEEQFYIVWPCLLFVAWKKSLRPWVLASLLIIMSFILNLIFVQHHAVFAFYTPMTRAWELLLGGLLAYVMFQGQDKRVMPLWVKEIIASIGLLLLLLSVFLLSQAQLFPSGWALLPTCGTLCLIASKDALVNRMILSHPLMTSIGVISYPLYLWHWPLLSYEQIIFSNQAPFILTFLLLLLSMVLATLTYQWVEKPFRFRHLTTHFPVAILCVLLIFIGAMGVFIHATDGVRPKKMIAAETFPLSEQKQFYTYKDQALPCQLNSQDTHELSLCFQMQKGLPTKAVWGDSHAEHLFPGLLTQDKQSNWLLIGQSSCPPILDTEVFKTGNQSVCAKNNDIALKAILNTPSIDTVVLASLGPFYIQDMGFAFEHLGEGSPKYWQVRSRSHPREKASKERLFYRGLDATITQLEAHGKRVILYHDVPEVSFMPSQCIKRPLSPNVQQCELDREAVLSYQKTYHALLMDLKAAHPTIEIFDPSPYLCDKKSCHVRQGAHFFYRDSHHLSAYGSEWLAKPFLEWLNLASV